MDQMITKDFEVTEVFNNGFVNIMANLKISNEQSSSLRTKTILDMTDIEVKNFQSHTSRRKVNEGNQFCEKV